MPQGIARALKAGGKSGNISKVILDETFKPQLLTGFGEINFGKQYRQGNRVYDSECIAMCLNAQPVGNMGGYSYLYVVDETGEDFNEHK